MALRNFSAYENHKTVPELYCWAEFVRGVQSELVFLSALNIFVSVHHYISGKHSDPSCSTQGNFTKRGETFRLVARRTCISLVFGFCPSLVHLFFF